ncbi:MAG: hypothetical protein HYX72_00595 [Acidobacteria bacterium]|nr:hypothetical protein [Acidobacteriota bacterium]
MQQFAHGTGIRVRLDIPATIQRLDQDTELALFRVAQESLTNIQRHSGSKSASLRIWREAGQVCLEVKNSGRGVRRKSSRNAEVDSGIGIAGMQERLGQLGGRLQVSSTSRGTAVRVTVPIHAPEHPSRSG